MLLHVDESRLAALYDYWKRTGDEYGIPYFFPVPFAQWKECFLDDRLEGESKFASLQAYISYNTKNEVEGFVQFGTPAFAWNKEGQRYASPSLLVIRHLFFDRDARHAGEELLQAALHEQEKYAEISGFFIPILQSIMAERKNIMNAWAS